MPYKTDIYDYSLKKLSDDGISFICERSLKTNKHILKYKDYDNYTTTVTIDPTSLICSDNNAISICAAEPKVKFELTEPKICKCCGAMIHDKKCEYCGVEYNYKEV